MKYLISLLTNVVGGACLGIAWLVPNSITSAILGFLSVVLLILPFYINRNSYLGSFLYGIIANALAFYWLINTISQFGGYDQKFSVSIYALFVIVHALPFPVFVFFARFLESYKLLKHCQLIYFFAWTTSIYTTIRIFPWHYGHTQLPFLQFVQIADIAGALGISLVMFLVAESLIRLATRNISYKGAGIFLTIFLLVLVYGSFKLKQYTELNQPSVKASLIQGDLSLIEKGDASYFQNNLKQYYLASIEAKKNFSSDLIIWPESVIQNPIQEPIQHITETKFLPHFQDTVFIVGALSEENKNLYNSAFAIDKDGSIPKAYHKRILMPFGEYMPFESFFPELRQLNPNVGGFTAGKETIVFNLKQGINAAPLICYEDLVPSLARRAVKQEANLLINLTNDAWFGHTVAAFQHNLIAAFRSIENRRFFLRSTNSGLTSIISPIGKVVKEAPIFSKSTLNSEIHLISDKTIYSKYLGNKPWWIVTILTIILAVISWIRKKE